MCRLCSFQIATRIRLPHIGGDVPLLYLFDGCLIMAFSADGDAPFNNCLSVIVLRGSLDARGYVHSNPKTPYLQQ